MSSDIPQPGMDASVFLDENGNVNLSQLKSATNSSQSGSKTITPELCDTFRAQVLDGLSTREVADAHGIASDSTIRKHIKGKCYHTAAMVDEPTVTFVAGRGWEVADE